MNVPRKEPTAADVANSMVEQLDERRVLFQDRAVRQIRDLFWTSFTFTNKNGNPAICPARACALSAS